VSAYPKPGNIHRTRDRKRTRYEHFLAGSVAIAPAIQDLALCGYDVKKGSKRYGEIGLGKYILKSVKESLNWQRGGNINLGIILLFSPLAASAGTQLFTKDRIEIVGLRNELKKIIQSAAVEDTLGVYEAISLAMTPNVLGSVEELDVLDSSSLNKIRREGTTLLDVFHKCENRDSICNEWITNFEITFTIGYPYLRKALMSFENINSAVVNTFLFLLSKRLDSLILRKSGLNKAQGVSEKAGMILEEGGLTTEIGTKKLWEFDRELQKSEGMLNPGTTADLTANSIFLLLLTGWRP
jgi:triphosphoribosyl-dephospho-CoA synthase